MPMLSNTTITTALTGVTSIPLQLLPRGGAIQLSFTMQAAFTYGSGGTTAAVWVQTSLDGGLTWNDVASFGGFTTASGRNAMAIVPAAVLVPIVLTDGTLASNTAIPGLIGSLWRTKVTTTGVYVATSLRVDIDGIGFTSQT